MQILALIPARSGSKSVLDKNIRPISGKPLLVYSIEHALACRLINRTIVSTDNPIYAEIARQHGAEVPFLRPVELSQDTSTDLEVFAHALNWLRRNEGYVPDICVHLRPTYPIRNVEDVENAVQILIDSPDIDSVRSVAHVSETPFKMWFRSDECLLSPVVQTDINDAYNLPRQLLPQAFIQNACIDVVRTSVITEMESMTGSMVYGYLMEDNFDIDTEHQLKNVERFLAREKSSMARTHSEGEQTGGHRTFCFDIDGVVASLVPDNRYDRATPISDNIEVINALYKQGHEILLFTARGSKTGIDWTALTGKQMREWGVKYHQLLFGKPSADYYIDDRLLDMNQLRRFIKEWER